VGRRHHFSDERRILEVARNIRQMRVVDVMVVVHAANVETANVATRHAHCRVDAESEHDDRYEEQSPTRSDPSPPR
jgi:hypothetical protein